MKYSYSGISQFKQCPRKFKAKYVDYTYTEPKSDQQNWGIKVHAHLEARFKEGTALPPEIAAFTPIIDTLAAAPGQIYVEQKLAMDDQFRPVDYKDRTAHVRTIIDVTKINNDRAFIGDYKTGKIKYEYDQLALSSVILMVNYPEITSALGMFFWSKVGRRTSKEYSKMDLNKTWLPFGADIHRIEQALSSDNFPPKPTPLCGWCHLRTCEHWNPHD